MDEKLDKISRVEYYSELLHPIELRYDGDDGEKIFEEQEMSDITKAVLANIFRDYWATPYQKERIEAKERYDLEKIEEEKRERYNPDNIFKKRQEETVVINSNLPVEIKKENFFKRIINFIISFIKKNN